MENDKELSIPGVYWIENRDEIRLYDKEKRVSDWLFEGQGNYAYVRNKYFEWYGKSIDKKDISGIVSRENVKCYLNKLIKDKGYEDSITKGQWLREAIEFRDGKKEGNATTVGMHRLIAQVKGFVGNEQGNTVNVQLNQQINLTQSDGTE